MPLAGPPLRRAAPLALLLFTFIITLLVYLPGFSGAFVFDDGPNILQNARVAITSLDPVALKQATLSGYSGPLGRPVSMLSFALNHYFTGFDPFYFKATNLAIHLLNGIGIFFLTTCLLSAYRKRFQPELPSDYLQWVSLAITAAWLLHPLNLTSVLYVVQRMTSLSALFGIWALVLYVWGRTRLYDGRNGGLAILASLLIFTPLSALCKENGALLPLMMLTIEFSLFSFRTKTAQSRYFLIGFFSITVFLPAAAVLTYIAMHPAWLPAGYIGRPFTLAERLMTEARVLWFYIRLIVFPTNVQMGLFHDDILISQSLFKPISTLLSIAGLAALLGISILVRKKAPLVTFSVLFFVSGHLLESSVFALEIAYEHRNYLPMYGPLLVLFFYMLHPLRFKENLRIRQVAAVLFIGLFAFSTFARAGKWSNPFDFAESEVAHHPNSPRNNGEMANIYANITTPDHNAMEMHYLSARYHYEKAVSLSPDYTNGLFGLIQLSSSRGKTVEPEWINMLEKRLSESTYAPDTGNQLMGLVTCQTKGLCKLPKNDIERILQAPLKNAGVPGSGRALALLAWTHYLINLANDYPAAVTALQHAIEASPNDLEYRLTLAQLLVALQRDEEAQNQLAILKRLDRMDAYAELAGSQQKLLDERRK